MRDLFTGIKISKYHILIIIIIVIGSFARLDGILNGTFGFTHDQGRDLLAGQNILQGHFTLIGPTTGLVGLFHGPIWSYMLAFFLFVGRGDPKVVLIGIALLFLIAEFGLYGVIKKYYGIWPALLSLTIFSLSPFVTAINGQLWGGSMIVLVNIIIVASLIELINGKKLYWLLGLALGLNFHFEAAGASFLLLSIALMFLLLNPFKTKLKNYVLLIGSFALTLVPQIIFEIRHGFLMTRRVIGYFGVEKEDFIAEHGIKSLEYKSGLFFDSYNKIFFRDNVDIGLIFLLILFSILLRLYIQNKKLIINTKIIFSVFSSIIFFMWIVANFYFDVVWGHFITGLLPFYIVMVVFILFNAKKYWSHGTNILVLILTAIMLLPTLNGLLSQNEIIGNHSYYRNQLMIVDEIYQDAGDESFNVVVYEPTTFSYTYDYLFSWYGEKEYGSQRIANEIENKLVYYIIEPDNISERREDWINDRDGDGEIIWEKEYWNNFEGDDKGLLLQKRIREKIAPL